MHRGYIRHYRAVREHWLHDNANYYMAWWDIVMLVNHEEKKLLIDGELITCKRGEALYSISTWATKLGKWWTVQKVKTFFKLLEADNMICCSGMRKTTRLSVVNYEKYNMKQPAANQQLTSSQPADNQQLTTTKELLSIKENEKEKRLLSISDIDEIYSHYPKKQGKKKAYDKLSKLKVGQTTKEIIITKLKQYVDSVDNKIYLEMFSTWCNGERWQDEYVTQGSQQQSAPVKYTQIKQETAEEQAENARILQETLRKLKQG